MTDRFTTLPDGSELWISGNTARTRPHPSAPWGPPRTLAPGARNTDPETSHAAAAKDRTNDRALVLAFHRNNPAGATDFEMAAALGRKQTSVGKRRGELVAVGLIEDSGLRRPSDTNTPAIVWRYCGGNDAA